MILEMCMSIAMLFAGCYVLYEASTYPDFSKLTPVGSEVFPSIMGWVIVICSLLVLLRICWKLFFGPDKAQNLAKEKEQLDKIKASIVENKRNLPAMIGIPVLMLLYALLLNTVGFEILSVLFLLICLLLCHERNIWRLILVPILGTVVMYYVFHILLKIMVPMLFLK